MPRLLDIAAPWIWALIAAVALAALAAALVFAARRSNKRVQARIDAAYGRAMKPEREDLSFLKTYHEAFAKARPNPRRVDETTWNDLNMDDVFQRLNACASSVGEEYLYHALHELHSERAQVEEEARLVRFMDEHPRERLALVKILMALGKRRDNGLSAYLFHAGAKKLPHAWRFAALAALPPACLVLAAFFPGVGLPLAALFSFVNILVYYRHRLALEAELESMRYFSALLYAAKAIDRRLGGALAPREVDLKHALKPFARTRGLVPGNVQRGMAELESLTLLVKSVFLVDLILYNRTVSFMLRYTDALNSLYETVGKLDAAVSVASFRRSLPAFCEPAFEKGGGIRFEALCHPLVENAVPNSAELVNDCIVTGSNASGKSTFVKAVAVNCILAQTVATCCAGRFSLDFFYVASSMALRDDLLAGESYFVAEVKSLKRILAYCRARRCAVFVDEILRGTNTPERIAASVAVLRSLHETQSLCLVASHDVELTEILAGVYDSRHFCETFEGDAISFDYLLKEGPSRSTNAIRLIERMGFEPRIVEDATAFLNRKKS